MKIRKYIYRNWKKAIRLKRKKHKIKPYLLYCWMIVEKRHERITDKLLLEIKIEEYFSQSQPLNIPSS